MDVPFAAARVSIQPLGSDDLPQAVAVVTAGMRDNPLHVRAFGADRRRRQQRLQVFLDCAVTHVEGDGMLLGAHVAGRLVGVLGMAEPGRCRPGAARAARCALAVATSNPPLGTWRVGRWLAAWRRRDPRQPHWHLGPLAVTPTWQGRGVGSQLLRRACAHLDAQAAPAWLEIDRPRNVTLYQRFGFVPVHDELVLGVRNWFMQRCPATSGMAPVILGHSDTCA